jgi:hypothetical protein
VIGPALALPTYRSPPLGPKASPAGASAKAVMLTGVRAPMGLNR